MIKTKKGFLLRRLGKEYMVVPVGEASKDFNGMIRLNETGAFYWQELEKGITKNELVRNMLERFEGLDEETACRDLKEFLAIVEVALEFDDDIQHD
ncbi:PqqD family protein [Acetatifactor aquisgranensis]|uniref:PqqD family protein n=1 Tax=Acetatifactor aquisgranensis TaxID=2941233 RepID=UPI00203C940A|nr:PqqD family protein [Acetatifactor aquisgranensis]